MTLLGTFLSSLGIAAIVGVTAFVAFCITFFVVCLASLPIALGSQQTDWILYVSGGAGLIPALLIVYSLFRRYWPRKG